MGPFQFEKLQGYFHSLRSKRKKILLTGLSLFIYLFILFFFIIIKALYVYILREEGKAVRILCSEGR